MHPILLPVCALVLGSCLSEGICAQSYPVKQVRIIVPTPAGGNPDFVARPVAQKISENLKQVFLIDNRPGAAGTIGVDLAVRAVADGYTILFGAVGHIVSPPRSTKSCPTMSIAISRRSRSSPTPLLRCSYILRFPCVAFVNSSLSPRHGRGKLRTQALASAAIHTS